MKTSREKAAKIIALESITLAMGAIKEVIARCNIGDDDAETNAMLKLAEAFEKVYKA